MLLLRFQQLRILKRASHKLRLQVFGDSIVDTNEVFAPLNCSLRWGGIAIKEDCFWGESDEFAQPQMLFRTLFTSPPIFICCYLTTKWGPKLPNNRWLFFMKSFKDERPITIIVSYFRQQWVYQTIMWWQTGMETDQTLWVQNVTRLIGLYAMLLPLNRD